MRTISRFILFNLKYHLFFNKVSPIFVFCTFFVTSPCMFLLVNHAKWDYRTTVHHRKQENATSLKAVFSYITDEFLKKLKNADFISTISSKKTHSQNLSLHLKCQKLICENLCCGNQRIREIGTKYRYPSCYFTSVPAPVALSVHAYAVGFLVLWSFDHPFLPPSTSFSLLVRKAAAYHCLSFRAVTLKSYELVCTDSDR